MLARVFVLEQSYHAGGNCGKDYLQKGNQFRRGEKGQFPRRIPSENDGRIGIFIRKGERVHDN
jgi:hypothetical protein